MKRKTWWILSIMVLLLLSFILYVKLSPEPELDFSALTSDDIAQIQIYPGTYGNPNSYLATLSREDAEPVLALLKQIDSHAQEVDSGAFIPDWAYQFRITFTDAGILSLGAGDIRYCLMGRKSLKQAQRSKG